MKAVFFVITIILANMCFAYADLQWSPVWRGEGGKVAQVSYSEAEEYCKSQSMRIPTAREWAALSVQHGAKGLRKTKYPALSNSDEKVSKEAEKNEKQGYYPTNVINKDKISVVDFYFNESGYHSTKDLKDSVSQMWWYWTSTEHPLVDRYFVYVFDGQYGHIRNTRTIDYYPFGVKCVK